MSAEARSWNSAGRCEGICSPPHLKIDHLSPVVGSRTPFEYCITRMLWRAKNRRELLTAVTGPCANHVTPLPLQRSRTLIGRNLPTPPTDDVGHKGSSTGHIGSCIEAPGRLALLPIASRAQGKNSSHRARLDGSRAMADTGRPWQRASRAIGWPGQHQAAASRPHDRCVSRYPFSADDTRPFLSLPVCACLAHASPADVCTEFTTSLSPFRCESGMLLMLCSELVALSTWIYRTLLIPGQDAAGPRT